jgi:beta-glucosidase-like glycosyl hydrolase
MTYQEKASNLNVGVPRLGVPPFAASEDTHGVGCHCGAPSSANSTGCPTTFPNGPSLGASFNRALWADIGRTIGLEARGLTNQGKCTLYFLDPNINLMRDPRWGRTQEVPGEDPYLTGEYGSVIISATQRAGDDERYLSAASTMKHFSMYRLAWLDLSLELTSPHLT